jgi:HemY protein
VRTILWFLLLAAVAVGISIAARYNEGYVLLVLPPWRAEVSLNLFILLLLALFATGHGFLRAVRHTLSLPRSIAVFRQNRAREKAVNELQKASRLLTEGRYGHAMRSAESAWPQLSQSPSQAGLVALLGWRAAHALRDSAQVALWRERAFAAGGDLDTARLMTEAELALDERRFDDARSALQTPSTRRAPYRRAASPAPGRAGSWQLAGNRAAGAATGKGPGPDARAGGAATAACHPRNPAHAARGSFRPATLLART